MMPISLLENEADRVANITCHKLKPLNDDCHHKTYWSDKRKWSIYYAANY